MYSESNISLALLTTYKNINSNIKRMFLEKALIDNIFNEIENVLSLYPDSSIYYYISRDYFNLYLAWAIPDKIIINKITEFVKDMLVLEIGAGKGLWAGLLNLNGVNIIATDQFLDETVKSRCVFDVVKMSGSDAICTYADAEVLLIIWAQYSSSCGSEELKKFKGKYIIIIGEDENGCTQDFELEKCDLYEKIYECKVKQWKGIYDNLQIFYIKES